MPKRRRNEDGSLVVPLSPRQQESLAKGRAALAAKASAPAVQGDPPAPAKASSSGRKVEVVKLSKASGTTAKKKPTAAGSRSRDSTGRKAGPPAATAPSPSKESRGFGDRVIDWLTST